MTQQDVDNGALYMPCRLPGFQREFTYDPKQILASTLLTFTGIKIEDYEIYFIKHIHHWHSN